MKLINSQKLSLVILTLACISTTRASDPSAKNNACKRPALVLPMVALAEQNKRRATEDATSYAAAERDKRIAKLTEEIKALKGTIDKDKQKQFELWDNSSQLLTDALARKHETDCELDEIHKEIRENHYDIDENKLPARPKKAEWPRLNEDFRVHQLNRDKQEKLLAQENADLSKQVLAEKERANKAKELFEQHRANLLEARETTQELNQLCLQLKSSSGLARIELNRIRLNEEYLKANKISAKANRLAEKTKRLFRRRN